MKILTDYDLMIRLNYFLYILTIDFNNLTVFTFIYEILPLFDFKLPLLITLDYHILLYTPYF